MNKETSQLIDYIEDSGFYLNKVSELRGKYKNIKDFQVMIGYLIMDIINTEPKFIHTSRKNIELQSITERYF